MVGLLGPRQSGKSTLLRELLGLGDPVSLDDLELREAAQRSPKAFLSTLTAPALIDEAQKAPDLFDAIKLNVDRKRTPGSYYLTGSTGFSSKLGIRESLTGRIGVVELLPLLLSELHGEPFEGAIGFASIQPPRFGLDRIMPALRSGGMPVPAFLRDSGQREAYWRSWLETALLRDLATFFPRGYDPDFAMSLLRRMATVMREGELPTLKHFRWPARRVRTHLSAMREMFLVRQISCHPEGIGKETWLFMDSGLAAHLMGAVGGSLAGEGPTLTLARHFLWNEWAGQELYRGKAFPREYYKSAQGSPVDALLDGVPVRIVASAADVGRRLKWEERPILGAMKKIGAKFGYLVAPVERAVPPPKRGGVGVLPWGSWS